MKNKICKSMVGMAMSIFAISAFMGASTILAPQVHAQAGNVSDGISTVEESTKLTSDDPRALIANIINIVLGVLGVIAVVIIVYGGFKWMTAAGNEDQVSEAKKIITSGIIGLVIVLLALSIAQFVLNALINATNTEA